MDQLYLELFYTLNLALSDKQLLKASLHVRNGGLGIRRDSSLELSVLSTTGTTRLSWYPTYLIPGLSRTKLFDQPRSSGV